MKATIHILLLLGCIFNPLSGNFYSVQLDNQTAYCFLIPTISPQLSETEKWNLFNEACFTVPTILEKSAVEKAPFLLLIPANISGLSPIDTNASIIEGSRIALAWTSAFFRFESLGNVDCRIALIPEDRELSESHIASCAAQLLQKNPQDTNGTPEKNIEKRIFSGSFIPHNECQIKPYLAKPNHSKRTIITPAFNSIKKRIVITGAAGFIPSYLCEYYLDQGYQVIGLDNFLCCNPDNMTSFKNHPNFSFHNIDVTHPYTIEGPVDSVLHFASVPSPADYYKMPIETLKTGLHATREALALAREKNARFVFASSSEVYGDPEIHPQVESYPGNVNPIGKRSQYDQSKRGGETLIKQYYEKYNLDVRIIRIFNTFGPRMRLDDGRMITNFIKATIENKPMIIHGDGNQTRSPAYVTDLVEAIVCIADSEKITPLKQLKARIFNAGNTEEYTVNQIAEMTNNLLKKYFNRTVPIQHITHFDLTDPKVRKPDISHLKKITNYEPQIPFKQGLEKMFEHYHHL